MNRILALFLALLAACEAPAKRDATAPPARTEPARPDVEPPPAPPPVGGTEELPRAADPMPPADDPNAARGAPRPSGLLVESWSVAARLDRGFEPLPFEMPNAAATWLAGDAPIEVADRPCVIRARGFLRVGEAGPLELELDTPGGVRMTFAGEAKVDELASSTPGPRAVRIEALDAGDHAIEILAYANDDASAARFALRMRRGEGAAFRRFALGELVHEQAPWRVDGTAPGAKRLKRPLARRAAVLQGSPWASVERFELPWLGDVVRGVALREGGRLLATTASGDVWSAGAPELASGALGASRFASGLADPRGIVVLGERVFVAQRGELVELADRDGDGVADDYKTFASSELFDRPDVRLLAHAARLAVAWRPERDTFPWMSFDLDDVDAAPYIRSDLAPLLALHERAEVFAGQAGPLALRWRAGDAPIASTWLPSRSGARAELAACVVVRGGSYAGQLVGAERASPVRWRVALDADGGSSTAFEAGEGLLDVHEALVGSSSDGSWLLARVARATEVERYRGARAFDWLTSRVLANGVELEFGEPLAVGVGWERENYRASFRAFDDAIEPTEAAPPRSATVSEDRRRVFLELEGLADAMRERPVLRIELVGPLRNERDERPFTLEGWTTIASLPATSGEVRAEPAAAPTRTEQQLAEGWRPLFDGSTLEGWHVYGMPGVHGGWRVENGTIARGDGGGDLVTDQVFESFELELEWKLAPGGNSGIFFHVADGYDYVWRTGPEMQVLDNALHADGASPLTSAGSNYALWAPEFDDTHPVGVWNHARLVVDGSRVEHWLNGLKQIEYELGGGEWKRRVAASKFAAMPDYGRFASGRIALQDHGDPVWFRNVQVRRIAKP